MKIINLAQRTPAWHIWRRQGVTASEAAVILNRSPYQTPWRLWAEKTGLCAPADLSNNPFVQRGIALEDQARQGFERRHDTLLLPVCAESTAHPVLRGSFDGLTEAGEPVELKVPGQKTWDAVVREGEASLAFGLYWIQVQCQLAITEAAQGWLVFDPVRPNVQALEFVIARDTDFIERELIPTCLEFHAAVQTQQEPTPDPERDCYVPEGEARAAWERLATQYRDADTRAARLETELKGLKAQMAEAQRGLVTLMGDFLLVDQAGLRILRYQQRGTLDYAAALGAIVPDLDPQLLETYRRPTSERVKVTRQDAPAADAACVPSHSGAAPAKRRRRQPDPLPPAPVSAIEETAQTAEVIGGYF